MDSRKAPELLLHTTAGCHLCEHAAEMLEELARERALRITAVDIAASAELVERYGLRIPVLRNPRTGVELNWPFVPEQIVDLL